MLIRPVLFVLLAALCPSTAVEAAMDDLAYYAAQGPLSDPGSRAHAYQDLPKDPAALAKLVQGMVLHGGLTWLYKVQPREEQIDGFRNHRGIEPLLGQIFALNPEPLTQPRTLDQRLIGNCRTFSLLMVSMLRAQGVPARMRVGYATYTAGPGRLDNHFILQYWNGERWVWFDPQMDEAQRQLHKLDFDPADLPAGKFIPAGEAWLRLKDGSLDPASVGLNGPKGWEGLGWDMVQMDLIADVWALSKVELITGESNALGRKPHARWTRKELKLLDDLARASAAPSSNLSGLRKRVAAEKGLRIDLAAWKP